METVGVTREMTLFVMRSQKAWQQNSRHDCDVFIKDWFVLSFDIHVYSSCEVFLNWKGQGLEDV